MEAKAITAELGEMMALQQVSLQVIGIRAKKLNRDLLAGSSGIILAGLAGALDPALAVGDIVVDSASSPLPLCHFPRGKFYATDHLAATAAEKHRLFRETGCAAVDMESDIVRAMAESLTLPMLHVRAISDAADEALPERMMDWIDHVGRLRTPKVLADLALHPHQIPAMIRLGKNSRLALRRLTQAVGVILGT
jgi:adenosylhomocysteine nucleosidase